MAQREKESMSCGGVDVEEDVYNDRQLGGSETRANRRPHKPSSRSAKSHLWTELAAVTVSKGNRNTPAGTRSLLRLHHVDVSSDGRKGEEERETERRNLEERVGVLAATNIRTNSSNCTT